MTDQLGESMLPVDEALRDLVEMRAVERILARDHTLWSPDPAEITNRLGWLDEPTRMRAHLPELRAFASAAHSDGARRAVWCGMGGSSLFPLVLREAFSASEGGIDLRVLDTSHPAAVARAASAAPREETLWCFASKSGGTIETRCHLDHMSALDGDRSRFVAVTDAGSELDALAVESGFRASFNANPDIGGRFSALSHFGLVPAALLGLDMEALLDGAAAMTAACSVAGADARSNPALRLAAALGAALRNGRDKCTIVVPAPMTAFGLWLEQLIAESTGKNGTGLIPMVGEPLGTPAVYGDDRVFVSYGDDPALDALAGAGHSVLRLGPLTPSGLGAEVCRWQLAVAILCALLGVNPFDQPDVEAAKRSAGEVLAGGAPSIPTGSVEGVLGGVRAGDFVSIQAFVDPGGENLARLSRARTALRDRLRVAVTLDLGPRYLHSTGQLHKGGPPTGVFLQVLDVGADDSPIPGRPFSFAGLISAQADGDYLALLARGRRVSRVSVDDLLAATAL